jgi:hypothetical protein
MSWICHYKRPARVQAWEAEFDNFVTAYLWMSRTQQDILLIGLGMTSSDGKLVLTRSDYEEAYFAGIEPEEVFAKLVREVASQ